MKGIIYYYSGTGNTKIAVQYIVGKIKNAEFSLFDIVKEGIKEKKDPNILQYDIIGIAVFTDWLGPSQIVKDFIEKLPQGKGKNVFVFNTCGNISGKTLKLLKKWLEIKDYRIIAGFTLKMPDNYPPLNKNKTLIIGENNPSQKEIEEFNKFIQELDIKCAAIKEKRTVPISKIKIGILNSILPVFSRKKSKKAMGNLFVDEAKCIECGICAQACPYNAIKLNPKPKFDDLLCFGCWACYNRCPEKCIYTKKMKECAHYPRPLPELVEKLKI
ncbi:MAG TPA: EFR1 family ferrodoxin [Spirochaetota bacterium]|nr:EFR1 family ferrodoxin [Spirochaetota bacterium]HOL56712.1 EFR1 family ferrodoxin [Spirochaetota bacterium]HPP04133.1 EFR1 family ferrodoxin [Spirochaetota bacterium]